MLTDLDYRYKNLRINIKVFPNCKSKNIICVKQNTCKDCDIVHVSYIRM